MPTYSRENLLTYFSELECPSGIADSVVKYISEFITITNIEPEFVFLEDLINDDGRRQFVGIILLTKDTWSEISLTSDATIWTSSIYKRIWHLALNEKIEITGTDVTDKSRLSIHVVYSHGSDASLSATGLNCKELITIYQHYLMPMLLAGELASEPAVSSSTRQRRPSRLPTVRTGSNRTR